MTYSRTRRRPPSPAAIHLANAGHTLTEVAEQLGCSRPHVSLMLLGRRAAVPGLQDALTAVAGPQVAARVVSLVPSDASGAPDEAAPLAA